MGGDVVFVFFVVGVVDEGGEALEQAFELGAELFAVATRGAQDFGRVLFRVARRFGEAIQSAALRTTVPPAVPRGRNAVAGRDRPCER